jgi:AcrR family transcriptional regulator
MPSQTSDKRTAILRATMELIAEHGFHGSPTTMIATRAGVGVGTIYRYFSDKEVLIKEVAEDIEQRLNLALMRDYPAGQPLPERLQYHYIGLGQFFIAHPLEFKFLGQFYDSPYGITRRRDKLFSQAGNDTGKVTLKSLFEQGIAAKLLKDLPLVILIDLFIGSLISVTRDHILGFIVLDQDLLRRAAGASWEAIRR